MSKYPPVKDAKLVGTYPGFANAGGGYVWDAVLEYRVWCHPERGAADLDDDSDYCYAFETYEEAFAFSEETPGAETPLALVLQEEYINESEPGNYIHVKDQRIAEWPVQFLNRPKRTATTIPDFFLS